MLVIKYNKELNESLNYLKVKKHNLEHFMNILQKCYPIHYVFEHSVYKNLKELEVEKIKFLSILKNFIKNKKLLEFIKKNFEKENTELKSKSEFYKAALNKSLDSNSYRIYTNSIMLSTLIELDTLEKIFIFIGEIKVQKKLDPELKKNIINYNKACSLELKFLKRKPKPKEKLNNEILFVRSMRLSYVILYNTDKKEDSIFKNAYEVFKKSHMDALLEKSEEIVKEVKRASLILNTIVDMFARGSRKSRLPKVLLENSYQNFIIFEKSLTSKNLIITYTNCRINFKIILSELNQILNLFSIKEYFFISEKVGDGIFDYTTTVYVELEMDFPAVDQKFFNFTYKGRIFQASYSFCPLTETTQIFKNKKFSSYFISDNLKLQLGKKN